MREAPFFDGAAWSFASIGGEPFPNFSNGLPEPVAERLNQPDSRALVADMQVAEWMSILRNALSHGGILYLDKDGRSAFSERVSKFGFVSGKFDRNKTPPVLTEIKILRISEGDYIGFLRRWVEWLNRCGLE